MKRIIGKFGLKRRIDKIVKRLPIDENFKPIIADIVLRRAAQFSRSHSELRADLDALVNNLERIRIVDREKMAIYNYALAVYCGADNEIQISADTLKESPERIYQIIAHELFHVMMKNNLGIDKFDKYNYILETRSNLYQELIAEKCSYRLTYPVNLDYSGFNSNVFGYEDISFVLDFIEATYGVNEQDILKHSLNGRYELARFLAKAGGEEIYEAEDFLDEIEVGGTLLLSTLYEDGDARTKRTKSKEEIDGNIISSVEALFTVCQNKIEERLEYTDAYSIEEIKKIKEEIAFSEQRLISVLKNRLIYFKSDLNVDVDEVWEKCIGNYAEDVICRLCDMEQLLADPGVNKSFVMIEGINSVREFTYDDDEFSKKFLTSRLNKRSFKVSRELLEKKKELDMYTEGWKNKRIIKQINRIVEIHREKTRSTLLIPARLAYETQPGDRTGIDIYRLNESQKQACDDALKSAIEGKKSNNLLEQNGKEISDNDMEQ